MDGLTTLAPRGNSLRKHLFFCGSAKGKEASHQRKRKKKTKKKQETFMHKSNLRTPISSHFLHQQTTMSCSLSFTKQTICNFTFSSSSSSSCISRSKYSESSLQLLSLLQQCNQRITQASFKHHRSVTLYYSLSPSSLLYHFSLLLLSFFTIVCFRV